VPVHPDTHAILSTAAGPHRQRCAGARNLDEAHLLALVLGIGITPLRLESMGANLLDSTIAFDLAEVDTAMLGGINLSPVSSFLGSRGLLLGYDVALSSAGVMARVPEGSHDSHLTGRDLLDAAVALFGRRHEPSYPFHPGSLVPCAHRVFRARGPVELFATVGVGIPKERREQPCILMEDVGVLDGTLGEPSLSRAVEQSVHVVAEIQGVPLERVLVGLRRREVPADHLGCALVACPYFLLPGEVLAPRVPA